MPANIEIRKLATLLDRLIQEAHDEIDRIPEGVSIEEECRQIDAASAAAVAIAQRIVAENATLAGDIAIRAKSAAWLDGALWS
jgi:hypothetical protein